MYERMGSWQTSKYLCVLEQLNNGNNICGISCDRYFLLKPIILKCEKVCTES